MKKVLLTLATGGAMVMWGTPAAQPLRAQSDDGEAVRATLEAFAQGIRAHDLSSVDTLWAEGRGVHIIEGGGVNHGWAEYRDDHLGHEIDIITAFEFSSIEPQVRGDVAWASFRYAVAGDPPSGHVEYESRATAVLEKQNGRWVIAHLHMSGMRISA